MYQVDVNFIPHSSPVCEAVNTNGAAQVLLVCEHASNEIFSEYRHLGLLGNDLKRHIAYDIGAADLTRALSKRLDAPAVLCGQSRLFIDCNRHPQDPSWIASESDGTDVPGNQAIELAERSRRAARVFHPFHRMTESLLDRWRLENKSPLIVPIHSFTPVLNGHNRPWHVGIVWRNSDLAAPLLEALRSETGIVVGDNEPYDGRQFCGYTIDRHAVPYDAKSVAIELRQDQISERSGVERWADILARCLMPLIPV
ncbi:N-formylglutamate amidohydrolase [Paraburkholderia acidicola]|uniref:N-formylglutamate amidohydrolase n=1 Tax=Paraburkholderia acidicola TaxID=1912599 RepID=A0ABV1LUD3_9BURK